MAESGRMHRKAEEETASGANGDDDNVARRRPGPSDSAWYLRAQPLVLEGSPDFAVTLGGPDVRPVDAVELVPQPLDIERQRVLEDRP